MIDGNRHMMLVFQQSLLEMFHELGQGNALPLPDVIMIEFYD
jgi:hypothetical protein